MGRLAPGVLLATAPMCAPGHARPETVTFTQEQVGSLPKRFTSWVGSRRGPGFA